MNKQNGMNYAPKGKPNKVVNKDEFRFSAIGLDHGHIYGMCNGLLEAGATLVSVYDPDPKKVAAFVDTYPNVQVAGSVADILSDETIALVAAAAIPSERAALGIQVMESGKDYFTDKTPFTSLEQLEQAKATVERTKQKYMVYYSERLHVESAVFAGDLIQQGAIGRVLQVTGFGPHRLNAPSRPKWFFQKRSMAAFFATSAAIRSSNSCIFPGPATRRCFTAKSPIMPILITLNLRITAMRRSSVTMARRTFLK